MVILTKNQLYQKRKGIINLMNAYYESEKHYDKILNASNGF